jgi:circadian clock protein KaiC
MSTTLTKPNLAQSGIVGLDEILRGGFARGHAYLVEGVPGSGKTTLAMQFAMEGARNGEPTLYITLSETCQDLHDTAASHGWSLDGIECLEVLMAGELGEQDAGPLMYHPAEIELGETLKTIKEAIERAKPSRVVIDSLTEIRLQAQTTLRYRREVLALRQFFRQHGCTALLLDELREEMTAQSVVFGIVEMHRHAPEFGPARRRIQVAKFRGVKFWEGYHDYIIERGGVQVFPRLVAADHRQTGERRVLSSGLEGLDILLGGGLPSGSTTLLIGPAGTGKSSTATQIARCAMQNGDRAAVFTFDETLESYMTRSAGLGMEVEPFLQDGRLAVQQIDPGELSPGQFAQAIRHAVEAQQARVLIIDSLNGYMNAMPSEKYLIVQLHELATYLNQKGIVTLLVMSQAGLVHAAESPFDTSYLTDNVILFRLFEAAGEVRHAISVVKKRTGSHEHTIREFELTSEGLRIGEPLRDFQGILTGVPRFVGQGADLMGLGK